MEFDVKYESCAGNHPVNINLEEIQLMLETGKLQVTKPVGNKGYHKTITITGTKEEFETMAKALLNAK